MEGIHGKVSGVFTEYLIVCICHGAHVVLFKRERAREREREK